MSHSNAGFRHQQLRGVASKELLQTPNPIAEQLEATNLWRHGRWSKASDKSGEKKKKFKGDKARVNITDEKLCDDIIGYLGPTLDRHVGCDLLDLFPGAGLWSRKLHDALQPRSHLLMEPDEELYTPMLKDLISRPNTTLIPKSGIVWTELSEVLNKTYLPHQVEQSPDEPPKRNDTLLVTANFSFYPKKKYAFFDNIAQLLLYQFINAVRTGSLFHKYGLIRMLIWVGDDEKNSVMARNVQRRKRLSVDAELSTEYIAEIVGADGISANGVRAQGPFARDHTIDIESSINVLDRMQRSKISIPAGRETGIVREVTSLPKTDRKKVHAGNVPAHFHRPYRQELEELANGFEAGTFDQITNPVQFKRYKDLKYKAKWEGRRNELIHELLCERAAMPTDLAAITDPKKREAWTAKHDAWEEKINRMDKYLRGDFLLTRDNLHVFRQDRPALSWDRRPVEPLAVSGMEFFPNVPCALLDIQPKAMHPLLREMGPGTTRAGDTFGLLLGSFFRSSLDPLDKVMESIYPGAAEGVLPHCPSLTDPKSGGAGYSGWSGLSPRALNEQQLVEILDAWMKWPFRPGFSELVGRGSEESDYMGDEESGAVSMGDFS